MSHIALYFGQKYTLGAFRGPTLSLR